MKSGSYIKLTDKDANVAVCKKTFSCSQPPKIPAKYLVPLNGPNIDFGYPVGRWLKDKQYSPEAMLKVSTCTVQCYFDFVGYQLSWIYISRMTFY